MTKKAIVKELFDQGMTSVKEIALKTGISYALVAVYVYQLRHPDKFKQNHAKNVKNWAFKNPDKRKNTRNKWRSNNPEKVSKQKMRQYDSHQKKTKVLAKKHGQEWLLKDIEYLRVHSQVQSAHQIATHLERTYKSVMSAAQRFGVNLINEKKGSEFVGKYNNETKPTDEIIQEA